MTKLMEALVVVGGLAALAYFMSKPKNSAWQPPGTVTREQYDAYVATLSPDQKRELDELQGRMGQSFLKSGNYDSVDFNSKDFVRIPMAVRYLEQQKTDNHKEAPPSANLMLNQHVGAAKQLVASGGDLTDLIGMRKDAARAVMENPGQVKQTPLPPPNVGYVNAMKRQNLSSGKIIFNKL
jgi:hypothetical protein